MDIERLYRVYLEHPLICTDSREVKPGSLFFALKGGSFDGNRYAAEALRKGAFAAVVDDPSMEGMKDMIVMGDALLTLQRLAHLHRERTRIRVIAITGTNGKTTTKELIAAVLSAKYRTLFTRGNLNNHIGVPLTLLSIRDEEVAVIEMGANHPGEIALLSDIADPDVGLITNVGKAHLEGFGSFEGVMEAKGELYDFLAEKEVPALVNTSNPWLMKMAEKRGVERIPYAVGEGEGICGKVSSTVPWITCEVDTGMENLVIPTKLVGSYNLENVLAAVAAGVFFKVPPGKIAGAISSYQPENKRSQLITGRSNTLILDAYNANPTSMMNALEDFVASKDLPLMVILGDMLELGAAAGEEHDRIVGWLKKQGGLKVCLVGPNFARAAAGMSDWNLFPDTTSCLAHLERERPGGYRILIKGSRKMSLEDTTKILLDC
ncbi:MAG: UDP-N-acetylmuramoyl-tripeptide--D-alanyl-D-alanine ligase [Bacteroidota bacterium]